MRIFVLSAALLISSPLYANENETSVSPEISQPMTSTSVERPKEKKICKRIESTESRLGAKKVCLTAEQWKRQTQL
jgi:hypothetical protein